jgi:hypothetical protein
LGAAHALSVRSSRRSVAARARAPLTVSADAAKWKVIKPAQVKVRRGRRLRRARRRAGYLGGGGTIRGRHNALAPACRARAERATRRTSSTTRATPSWTFVPARSTARATSCTGAHAAVALVTLVAPPALTPARAARRLHLPIAEEDSDGAPVFNPNFGKQFGALGRALAPRSPQPYSLTLTHARSATQTRSS